MRSRFAILLAIAVVCATIAWASWTPEALVTSGSDERGLGSDNSRKLAFASDGVGHLVWHTSLPTAAGVYCNRYDPGTGWASDYQISPTGSRPAIALDADGTTIHAIWDDVGYGGVCYRKCTRQPDGSDQWGPIVYLWQRNEVVVPAVACVPGEPSHVVVCWEQNFVRNGREVGEAIGFIECINGQWGTPIMLDSAAWRRSPSIAVAPNGDVFIAYVGNNQIYVKTRHNGAWGTTVNVTTGLSTDQCGFPAIEVNPVTGNPHVAFQSTRTTQISKKVKVTTSAVYHTYRTSSSSWLTVPELISVPRQHLIYLDPTMVFLNSGATYAVWHWTWPDSSRGAAYNYCSVEGGAWSGQAWVSADTVVNYYLSYTSIAFSAASQTLHVVMDRIYDSIIPKIPREIWWSTNYVGGGGGMGRPVALSQSGVELFPNPAKAGRVMVQYSLPRAEPLRVTLLDVSGRTVRTQEVAADRSGVFSVDASGLHAGVYILKLESGTTSQTRKLVIQ
jgi:hypothetical protein